MAGGSWSPVPRGARKPSPRAPRSFFFSSRRRHTRSKRDWSSDVYSSDLELAPAGRIPRIDEVHLNGWVLLFTLAVAVITGILFGLVPARSGARRAPREALGHGMRLRSEERRVGKECGCRGAPSPAKR